MFIYINITNVIQYVLAKNFVSARSGWRYNTGNMPGP